MVWVVSWVIDSVGAAADVSFLKSGLGGNGQPRWLGQEGFTELPAPSRWTKTGAQARCENNSLECQQLS